MERLSIQKPQSGWIQPTRPGAEDTFGALDGAATSSGGLDVVDLDVDHADAELDLRVHVLQRLQILRRTVGHFEHQVIHVQLVEEVDQRAPLALLDRLSAVVAEAEVHGALAVERHRARS